MKQSYLLIVIIVLAAIAAGWYIFSTKPVTKPAEQTILEQQQQTPSEMSFFITSVNLGKGADLGGLAGADNYCQSLASATGAGNKTWKAYLSTQATDNSPAVNARDRIGQGPWKNFQGVTIANNSDTDEAKSWNSSHLTRGCSLEALATTGSGGLLYCFAVR